MCLIIYKDQKYQIMEEDMTVYKVLEDVSTEISTFRSYSSPIFFHIYTQGVTFEDTIRITTSNKISQYNDYEGDTLIEEGLHSLINIRDANTYMDIIRKAKVKSNLSVHRFTIPKGTKYYRGLFKIGTYQFEAIASTALYFYR